MEDETIKEIKDAIIKNDIEKIKNALFDNLDYIDEELLKIAYSIGNNCAFDILIKNGANIHIIW